ncbi:MAG TPA: PTS sugar transporter subunit IIA [Caldithrix abyssi]|uniref:PTS sugar transporter subunit IIA n=1 Tax=Caldithrix abyssi TaxID=187145 RepID=A0A7V5RPV1_CALAY|nr:PTS sugar transporter subunit IIA [Caldithrix abyssi]
MSLSEYLTVDHIKVPLEATTRDGAIRELIEMMAPRLGDSEKAYTAVLEREKIMTTGVGNGLAIPHCKNESCPEFAVALGVQPQGIDFESVDKQPVKIVVLLVGPENSPAQHIKLLSRISRLLNNAEFRDNILKASSPQEIAALIDEYDNAL